MKTFFTLLFFFVSSLVNSQNQAPTKIIVDSLYTRKIVDEYRNFEDKNDLEVKNWIDKKRNEYFKTIESISNHTKILENFNQIKSSKKYYTNITITPSKRYFYIKEDGDEMIGRLYYKDSFESEEQLLYDPRSKVGNETKTKSIILISPSFDGKKIAVALSDQGSDLADIVVIDVDKKSILPEIINHTKPAQFGGVKWLYDNSGFTYSYIPEIDSNSEQYLLNIESKIHKIGKPVASDITLLSKKNNPNLDIKPEKYCRVRPSYDNYYIGIVGGIQASYYYAKVKDIYTDVLDWKPLFNKDDLVKSYFRFKENIYYISEKNKRNIICKTSIDNPSFNQDEILVKEIQGEVIDGFDITPQGLFFTTLKNGVSAKFYCFKNGNYKEIRLPIQAGSININSVDSRNSNELRIECSSWTEKKNYYSYDTKSNTFKEENLRPKFHINYDDIIVEEVEVKGHDGVLIPLSILYKKGTLKNKKNRTIIEAYGSYGISNDPYFSPYLLSWVKNGGIYVSAHVRGGGEKGKEWHLAGKKENKPNSWKDLISCTEYLINNNYTSPMYIGVEGSSAGGITVGRAIEERPDLFKAAYLGVAMLNIYRNEFAPNGTNNTKEFGTIKIKEECEALLQMDPYLHIKKGVNYPNLLITAGLVDSRVAYWLPAKFAAKMEAYSNNKNLVLLNVDPDLGHEENSTVKEFEHLSNKFLFFYWQLGHPDFQIKK